MAFYIYDPKGYRLPYYPGEQWRSTKAVVETRPSDEKSRHAMRDAHEQLSRVYNNRFIAVKKSKREEADIVASQIMNQPVITLKEDTPIQVAWNLFLDRRFRHIPIVNSENIIIGILSDRRLLREFSPFNELHEKRPETVGQAMIKDILTSIPETPVKDIAKTFIRERVGCMPIAYSFKLNNRIFLLRQSLEVGRSKTGPYSNIDPFSIDRPRELLHCRKTDSSA